MRVHMSIRILVLMVVLIAGDSQLLGSSILYQMPLLQISNTSSLPFYSCKFNVKVDCFWKVDGTTISLSLHNYTWMIGNGTNTNDCSIQGRSHQVLKLNQKYNADVTCTGISYGAIKKVIHLGDSIRLDCSFSERSNCSWKRSHHVISISGRYEYIEQHDGSNAHDCSIRIERIERIDLTTWMCQVTATDGKGQRNLTNALYNLQLYNTADPTNIESSATTDSSTIKRLKDFLTTSDKVSLPSTMDPPTPSDSFMANSPPIQFFLGFAGILLLIAITIGFTQLIRKCVKKKNTEHNDDKRNHDEENRDRISLEAIGPSTADQPHAYHYITTITSQSQAEDANGYLVPLKVTQNANSNETKAKFSKRSQNINDPKNHIYEKVDDKARSKPQ